MYLDKGHNPEHTLVNSVNFLGNGGFFANGLASIKRLITTRPTLKQYMIQRRTENYYSTVRPHHNTHTISSSSPCKQGSTECILRHLRNRGLIRNTFKSQYRRPKTIKLEPDKNLKDEGKEEAAKVEVQDSLPVYRGKGHYRPDCWSSDGENDQAPPIDYAQYPDSDGTETMTTEATYDRKIVIRANRRSADKSDTDPCLWQEY